MPVEAMAYCIANDRMAIVYDESANHDAHHAVCGKGDVADGDTA